MNVGENFYWYYGTVENTNDPLKLGRVQVRVFDVHTEDKQKLPTAALPWAQPVQPIGSAALGDVGSTPTGMKVGSFVFGFFQDGVRAQMPMVLGTIAGIPQNGVGRQNEPDVNRLARNDEDYQHEVLESKESLRTSNVAIANGSTWSEPASTYAATYPNNHVTQTDSGHILELDDTSGAERIHLYHKSGTFVEVDANGNKQTRVVGDSYEVVAGNNFVNIKGNVNLTIDSNLNTYVKGDYELKVDGNVKTTIGGNVTSNTVGNVVETIGGDVTSNTVGNIDETIGGNVTESVSGNVDETIGGNVTESVSGNVDETIGGNVTESVSGNFEETVSGTTTSTTSGAVVIKGSTIDLN